MAYETIYRNEKAFISKIQNSKYLLISIKKSIIKVLSQIGQRHLIRKM